MKKSISKIKKPDDSLADEPTVSFSHLAASFSRDEIDEDNPGPSHGFPSAQEESLYETGILLKDFLKC